LRVLNAIVNALGLAPAVSEFLRSGLGYRGSERDLKSGHLPEC
jgi:hypothetical protein